MIMNEQPGILLVDDRAENLKPLVQLLQDFNVELITADNGHQAIEYTRQKEFALILLDLQMPEMDGYEVARLMRTRIDTPIIFITAYNSDQRNVDKENNIGVMDYLLKPINPEILKNKVRVFLTLSEQKHQLGVINKQLVFEIDRRRQAEHSLRKSRDNQEKLVTERALELQAATEVRQDRDSRIKLVIDNIPVMVAFMSHDLRFLFANKHYRAYVNAKDNLEGRHLEEVLGSVACSQLSEQTTTVLNGEISRFECNLSLSEKKDTIISASYIPHIVDGIVKGFFALLQDVTEERSSRDKQRRLETQVRQIKKLKAMSTLSGGVAHEFNNLLVPIIGFSKMVRKSQAEDSREADYMDRVIKSAYRAKEIVSQIRLFSQKKDIQLSPQNLKTIINQVGGEIRKSLPENTTLETIIDPTIPPILGNTNLIRQILHNLLENALEAMPDGGRL